MAINDGGPAFPKPIGHNGAPSFQDREVSSEEIGMSLRDYFAGQALAGIMGDPGMRPATLDEFAHMAMRMYEVADAMLEAREAQP